jgi:hypothetical protein
MRAGAASDGIAYQSGRGRWVLGVAIAGMGIRVETLT